ncbi:MAPEG family protein [Novosphingobium sp. 9]|uniref:MAPEG family protein n=1 Tax=Novosphingobium sp. 9 TaxID=2025349 RepID=UPI0021B6D31A|nr:MAPEG family protein [Novosphingobium sp. 9]
MILQTTLCLAAAAAVINLWLIARTIQMRFALKALSGDGGDARLAQRMRAQANFVENAPFALILCALIDLSGKGGVWLAPVGAIFMIARVLHAFGMDRPAPNPLRAGGMFLTLLSLAGLAIAAVLIAVGVL